MTKKTDLILGPEIYEFSATTVRVEYETDDGASFFNEVFGHGALQVSILKSSIPAFIDRISDRGLSHRIGYERELIHNAEF